MIHVRRKEHNILWIKLDFFVHPEITNIFSVVVVGKEKKDVYNDVSPSLVGQDLCFDVVRKVRSPFSSLVQYTRPNVVEGEGTANVGCPLNFCSEVSA